MKHMLLAICISFLTALPAFPADTLKEGFEGPNFPPSGWSIETSGTGPYWTASWSRVTYGGSQWAFGSAVAGEGTGISTSEAKLFTPYETLNQGDSLSIRFTCFSEINPIVSVQNCVSVYLYNGSDEIWHYTAYAWQISSTPIKVKLTTGSVPVTSSNYRMCWWLHAVGGMTYYQTWASSHIDDVVISLILPASNTICPSSLGILKTVYR